MLIAHLWFARISDTCGRHHVHDQGPVARAGSEALCRSLPALRRRSANGVAEDEGGSLAAVLVAGAVDHGDLCSSVCLGTASG